MKKYIKTIAIVALAVCSQYNSSFAQLSDEGELPEKYREISLGFGPRTLSTVPGTIRTEFVDNSPSMDNFTGLFDVEDSYTRTGFNLGYNWGRYNGLSHKVFFDISLGDHGSGIFGYGIGWNISSILGNGILTINQNLWSSRKLWIWHRADR